MSGSDGGSAGTTVGGTRWQDAFDAPEVGRGLRAGVSRVLSGSDADFDDAVQDGWVILMRQRDIRSPVSVAFYAGRSAAVEIVRRRERSGPSVPLDRVTGRIGAFASAPSPFLRARLERAIQELPPGQRDIFLRTAVEGHSLAAVARQAGVHPGSARSQAFKARRHLQRALADLNPVRLKQPCPSRMAS